MDKRITELATEVGISVEYLTNTNQLALIERFAELIVQECLDIVDDEGGGEGGSVRAWNRIRQQFGIEK